MGLVWRAVEGRKMPKWREYDVEAPKNPGEIFLVYDPILETTALDIQSKALEGALCPVMISDIRNFSHGLFHYVHSRSHYVTPIFLCTKRYEKTVREMNEMINPEYSEMIICENGIGSNFDAINRMYMLLDSYSKAANIDLLQPNLPSYAHKMHYDTVAF